jgi:hypothetical protein
MLQHWNPAGTTPVALCLLNGAFTPRVVQKLRPKIRRSAC